MLPENFDLPLRAPGFYRTAEGVSCIYVEKNLRKERRFSAGVKITFPGAGSFQLGPGDVIGRENIPIVYHAAEGFRLKPFPLPTRTLLSAFNGEVQYNAIPHLTDDGIIQEDIAVFLENLAGLIDCPSFWGLALDPEAYAAPYRDLVCLWAQRVARGQVMGLDLEVELLINQLFNAILCIEKRMPRPHTGPWRCNDSWLAQSIKELEVACGLASPKP